MNKLPMHATAFIHNIANGRIHVAYFTMAPFPGDCDNPSVIRWLSRYSCNEFDSELKPTASNIDIILSRPAHRTSEQIAMGNMTDSLARHSMIVDRRARRRTCTAMKACLPHIHYSAWDVGICVSSNACMTSDDPTNETPDFCWSYYHDLWTCEEGELG